MEVQVGGLSDGLGLDASPSVSGPLFGRAPKAIIGAIAVAVVLVMALSGGDDDGGSGGGAGAGTEAATSGMPAVDCASSTAGAILGACGASPAGPKATSVMFSGNSFTYGPPHKYPDYVPDGGALNNLPRLFKLVADSLGDPVDTYEDTIGGCTNYAHRPTACPLQADGVSIAPGCERVVSRPVSYSDHVLAADGHVTSGPVHGFPRVRNDATMGLTWAELNQCAIPWCVLILQRRIITVAESHPAAGVVRPQRAWHGWWWWPPCSAVQLQQRHRRQPRHVPPVPADVERKFRTEA